MKRLFPLALLAAAAFAVPAAPALAEDTITIGLPHRKLARSTSIRSASSAATSCGAALHPPDQ
jgi:hypothetical protein